jgi:hypothetical protein
MSRKIVLFLHIQKGNAVRIAPLKICHPADTVWSIQGVLNELRSGGACFKCHGRQTAA